MADISATGGLILSEISVSGSGVSTYVDRPQNEINNLLIGEQYVDNWAYDLSKDILSTGEVLDEKAINISIENILSTLIGERFFSPFFGSILPTRTFEQFNISQAEELLYSLLDSIALWEDRITIVQSQIQMNVLTEENTLILVLPYIININELTGTFSRKIVV